MKLTYENINKYIYRVCFNNQRIGELAVGDDGYFIFFADSDKRGGMEEWLLRELADELKRINKPWDDQVNKDTGKLYCAHTKTHWVDDPTEPHIGPSVEVCDICRMSRKTWEQGETPWMSVELCSECDQPCGDFGAPLSDAVVICSRCRK